MATSRMARRALGRRRLLVVAAVVALALVAVPAALADDGDFQAPPKVEEPLGGAVPGGSATDHTTKDREDEALAREGLSVKERKMRENAEKFEFQAEISRLMDIIINSLYSNKDIFLRELISNGSDALDKIRFLSLTDPTVLGDGDTAKLEIQIKLDKANKMLTIRDRGIGMTREDLVKNLGTIAKSGTSSFLEQMQKGGDLNLIGQFGVGFYSAYLVSDYVEVVSKHNNDTQYIWESGADGSFSISEDKEGEPLGRGTLIKLHLKDEAVEYLEEDKLRDLVKQYSEFINFPIYLWSTKEVSKEVPIEEEEAEAKEDAEESKADDEAKDKDEDKDDEEVTDADEEEEEEKPKTKTVTEKVSEWELLNDVKALWLRDPKELDEAEYQKFYRAISKDYQDAVAYSHFKAEGDVEFRSILFIPPSPPPDQFENYYTRKGGLKLFVRRVFISDEIEELLPRYLSFLKGVVDSDTLPLNVSREMLQAQAALRTIRKKLVRKALDMLKKMADEEKKEEERKKEEEEEKKKKEEEGEEEAEEETAKPKAEAKYSEFWSKYSKAMKMGLIEDSSNRQRIAKLIRFYSSKSGDKYTGFEDYISRMKPDQKFIYYMAGDSKEALAKSPFIEKLTKKGYEVIYFTEPIDEYALQNLSEYDDKKLQNVAKDDLKITTSKKQKEKVKEIKSQFKDLTKWWKEAIGADDLEGVKVSTRLSTSPLVVVTSKYGWTANMERIMKAQAMADDNRNSFMKARKTLEINPYHPVIKELKEKVAASPDDPEVKDIALLLYESALVESGFDVSDARTFSARMLRVAGQKLNVDPAAAVEEEEEEEDGPEEEEGAAKDGDSGEFGSGEEDDDDSAETFNIDPSGGDAETMPDGSTRVKVNLGGEPDVKDEL